MAFLKKQDLLSKVAEEHPDIPRQIVETVGDLIIRKISDALAGGQEVSLRGFGRIIPRYYQNTPNKRLGLLFHPSPKLTAKCNQKP